MVARHDELLRFQDRDPAGGFQSLTSLIYHHSIKLHIFNGIMIGADKRSGDHLRFLYQIINDELLGLFYLTHNAVRFVKQSLPLLSLSLTKIAFVFVRHVLE